MFISLVSATCAFAQGAGTISRVEGDQVFIRMEQGEARKGDRVRVVHVTAGGMEIEAGTWIVDRVSDSEVTASVHLKKVTPRKGMKALVSPREKGETLVPAKALRESPQETDTQLVTKLEAEASAGNAKSQHRLGYMYQNGQGVEKNEGRALYWYRKAADQNHLPSINNLGWTYQNGFGIAKDLKKAVSWYQKAADQGFAAAQDNLGWMYQTGQGVSQNYTEAFVWYRKAADQDHANAQNNLARLYAAGYGVKQDYAAAARWYRKAADQGHPMAQYNLARLYQYGNGMRKDGAQAIHWYEKAAAAGNQAARQELLKLQAGED
jgi:TPR repeat protein